MYSVEEDILNNEMFSLIENRHLIQVCRLSRVLSPQNLLNKSLTSRFQGWKSLFNIVVYVCQCENLEKILNFINPWNPLLLVTTPRLAYRAKLNWNNQQEIVPIKTGKLRYKRLELNFATLLFFWWWNQRGQNQTTYLVPFHAYER